MAASERRSIAREMWEAMKAAEQVVGKFKEVYGREPTDAELRVAASVFIEQQKSGGRRQLVDPPAQRGPEVAETPRIREVA